MVAKKIKDKVLREPQSIDAEKAVLGSMLISKDAVPRAMNILIDNSLERIEYVFAAAGHPNCIFKITYDQLIKITNGAEREISE